MKEIDITTEVTKILARRNIEIEVFAYFDQEDGSPADISTFGVSAFFADALADQTQGLELDITDSVVPGGSYWVRDNAEAKVTVILGADTTKDLPTGKKHYLQIYLTDGGKPVKDVLYEITFKAGGKK